MIVYSTGLDNNPETLVSRAKHAFIEGNGLPSGYDMESEQWSTYVMLEFMYHAVFHRTDVHGDRSPYPFGEVVQDLVKLGFDVRDWTSNVKSILPTLLRNADKPMKLAFRSLISPAKATVKVANHAEAVKFTRDMEQSGLWLFVSWETAQ